MGSLTLSEASYAGLGAGDRRAPYLVVLVGLLAIQFLMWIWFLGSHFFSALGMG